MTRDKRNIAEAVPMERCRNNRRRGLSRPYTYAGQHPAPNERFGFRGISQRQKFVDDVVMARQEERNSNRVAFLIFYILFFLDFYGIIFTVKFKGAKCVWRIEEVMFMKAILKAVMILSLENAKNE